MELEAKLNKLFDIIKFNLKQEVLNTFVMEDTELVS
jgi:hypothetical protein